VNMSKICWELVCTKITLLKINFVNMSKICWELVCTKITLLKINFVFQRIEKIYVRKKK